MIRESRVSFETEVSQQGVWPVNPLGYVCSLQIGCRDTFSPIQSNTLRFRFHAYINFNFVHTPTSFCAYTNFVFVHKSNLFSCIHQLHFRAYANFVFVHISTSFLCIHKILYHEYINFVFVHT